MASKEQAREILKQEVAKVLNIDLNSTCLVMHPVAGAVADAICSPCFYIRESMVLKPGEQPNIVSYAFVAIDYGGAQTAELFMKKSREEIDTLPVWTHPETPRIMFWGTPISEPVRMVIPSDPSMAASPQRVHYVFDGFAGIPRPADRENITSAHMEQHALRFLVEPQGEFTLFQQRWALYFLILLGWRYPVLCERIMAFESVRCPRTEHLQRFKEVLYCRKQDTDYPPPVMQILTEMRDFFTNHPHEEGQFCRDPKQRKTMQSADQQ